MARFSNENAIHRGADFIPISPFPMYGQLETAEQIRGFELLRLAFFALKLRKLEQRHELVAGRDERVYDSIYGRERGYRRDEEGADNEYEFRCSLLRHAIFQQVLALIALDAREQALQLIDACRH